MYKDWQVVYVKANCEQKVAQACRRAQIPHYLPMTTETRTYQRRKEVVHFPFFRGYLFAAVTPSTLLDLQRTQALVRLIAPTRPMQLLRELVVVRRCLRCDPTTRIEPAFKTGDPVRVVAGPLRGMTGCVERINGCTRLTVTFEMLYQQVSTNVAIEDIEPLPPELEPSTDESTESAPQMNGVAS